MTKPVTLVDELVAQMRSRSPEAVIGAVAVALARRDRLDPSALVSPNLLALADADLPDAADLSVDLLGALHEHGQDATQRRRRGSHYTPTDVARRLFDVVRSGRGTSAEDRVCDPTVGGGAFLLAAGRALEADGVSRSEVVTRRLHGADVDPTAVAVTRTALSLWAGQPCPHDHLVVADTLIEQSPFGVDFDIVVGNPPFLSPLARSTAPDEHRRRRLKERFGAAWGPYVDAAALFLLVGLEMLATGGTMALVQPLSFLAARDTSEVRRRLLHEAALCGLWVAPDRVFGASVEVCAPVVERGGERRPVMLYRDRDVRAVAPIAAPEPGELARAAAPMFDIPAVSVADGGDLGEVVTVTAGFRDEYYAIADAVREGGSGPKVVTAGRIGPLRLDPARRPVRIQRRDYSDPRLDAAKLAAENERVSAWVERLAVPKLLVATQTPTIEVVVDPDGMLVPLTPVIAVVPPPELVWAVAGLLSAPSISALAAARTLGVGRHSRVIKLAAREIRQLPGLTDTARWRRVGRQARAAQEAATDDGWRAGLVATARAADVILGVESDQPLAWWADRLNLDAGLHASR